MSKVALGLAAAGMIGALATACDRLPNIAPTEQSAKTDRPLVTFTEPAQLSPSEITSRFVMPLEHVTYVISLKPTKAAMYLTVKCDDAIVASGSVRGVTGRVVGMDMDSLGREECNSGSLRLRIFTVEYGGTNLVEPTKPWEVSFSHGKIDFVSAPTKGVAETPNARISAQPEGTQTPR